MEVTFSPQALQTPGRKTLSAISQKDLWLVVREGSLNDVELALALLKKIGCNINLRNTFGLTPLHIATWRNHIPIVRRLLVSGADPDARDGESGWSSLHRALHLVILLWQASFFGMMPLLHWRTLNLEYL